MEEKTNVVMEHPGHDHLLILNENYIAKEGDVCRVCGEEIDSCESSPIYSCINVTSTASTSNTDFLVHKTCAELPREIVNPTDPNEVLSIHPCPWGQEYCIICGLFGRSTYFTYQQSKEDTIFVHPGHSHPLALIEHPSSFQCFVCKVNDNILDSSYRCTKCQFWIHKSCGDAPPSFQFQFHKHPLILSFSLPEVYQKFYQFCRICNEKLYWIEWIYCCLNCRYFTHFQCARSRSSLLSSGENETFPNLVHLPAADELSQNLLLEQFIKDKIILSDSSNNSSISIHPWVEYDTYCIICDLFRGQNYFTYRSSLNPKIYVCFKCAVIQVQQSKEDSIFVHPGHSHPLALIEKLSSFECCACKVNDNILDSSYRCTKCQFWIHKSCGDAPPSFQFQFHKHPLILSSSHFLFLKSTRHLISPVESAMKDCIG
ncbi:uncharacterized protein LOC141683886 [Apium graveolens]|uniref:uncharacterized protein LOC141683886 n=1 Tax=Apium graveolens TaxID=4045 RepID=UPI003D7B8222